MIAHIDSFGNLITNIEAAPSCSLSWMLYHRGDNYLLQQFRTYDEAKTDSDHCILFLIVGSSQTLEISIKNGNAQSFLHTTIGTHITLCPQNS